MREILFRGKTIDTREWVEGYYMGLYSDRIYTHDMFPVYYDVDLSTIGQCTGLTDKNGKKIFEGDIVKYDYDPEVGFIEFSRCAFHVRGLNNEFVFQIGCLKPEFWSKYYTVVGNIYDNPELLNLESKA